MRYLTYKSPSGRLQTENFHTPEEMILFFNLSEDRYTNDDISSWLNALKWIKKNNPWLKKVRMYQWCYVVKLNKSYKRKVKIKE